MRLPTELQPDTSGGNGMKTTVLTVNLLKTDTGTQNRLRIHEETVAEYAEILGDANGEWPFPPLDVFHDGSEYFVADGFHRFLAAQRSKRGTFPCRIHSGTAKDARIFGMTANDRHGLRMTRADKRACVEWLLDNADRMTQTEIAETAGVASRTVKRIVAERNDSSTAGKTLPPKVHGKGTLSPSTPNSGGTGGAAKCDGDKLLGLPEERRRYNCQTYWDTFACRVLLYSQAGWSEELIAESTAMPCEDVSKVLFPSPPIRTLAPEFDAEFHSHYRKAVEHVVAGFLWTAYAKAAASAEQFGHAHLTEILEARGQAMKARRDRLESSCSIVCEAAESQGYMAAASEDDGETLGCGEAMYDAIIQDARMTLGIVPTAELEEKENLEGALGSQEGAA